MDQTPKKISEKKKLPKDYGRYFALGIQMAASILVCVWAGRQGDSYFNLTQPIFTLTGAILGIAISLYWLFTAKPSN
jgi:F0F1-type ATP synthase assembly protein I